MSDINYKKAKIKKSELRKATNKEMVSDQHLFERSLDGHNIFDNLKQDGDDEYEFKINVTKAKEEEYNDKIFYIINEDFAMFPIESEEEVYRLIYQK